MRWMTHHELIEEDEKRQVELRKQVYFQNDAIVLNIDYEYVINIDRLNTPEKVLHWAWHLSEKSWITPEIIQRFIELSCRKANIIVPIRN